MMRAPKKGEPKTINTGISVPEAFYKVFVYDDENGALQIEAYMVTQHVRQGLKKNGYTDVADERADEKVALADAETEGHFTLGNTAVLEKLLRNTK
jgi:DNA/RNA endonuclease G (NUC1)